MLRYALICAHPSSHGEWRDRAEQAQLAERSAPAGLLLFTSRGLPVIASKQAVIIGSLHSRRAGEVSVPEAPPEDAQAVLQDWWGPFVHCSLATRRLELLREPSGGLPCYHLRRDTSDLFLSDAVTAEALGAMDGAVIDELFLRHWLQFPFLRSARTGFSHVTEVLPGTLLQQMESGWRHVAAWCPPIRPQGVGDWRMAQAAVALRDCTLDTVADQLSGRRALLQLSGGLDSSIIAAALHARGIAFQAVTFATLSPDGDERGFAQAVADRCGVRLEVVREDPGAALPAFTTRTFRPAANLLLRTVDDHIEELSRQSGCSLLADGAGGDNLFGSSVSAAPVADALLSGRGVRTVSDVARRTGQSWWAVAGASLRELRSSRGHATWQADQRFLARATLLAGPDHHPWLVVMPRLTPGRREHLHSLVHIQHFLDRHETAAEVVHPLYARPLLDLCLQVPSWLTVAGGRDRAVAREAFRPLLPSSVIQRRDKGSLEGLLHRRFTRLGDSIRTLTLEGELARSGLLDRPAIESALRAQTWHSTTDHVRLSEIATIELWLQGWRAAR